MKTIFFIFFNFIIILPSFGGATYQLNWDNPNEYVEYHSCGCGDSCWVAEVKEKSKEKKIKKAKLTLRCDCSKLYISRGTKKSERVYQNSCSKFECDKVDCKSDLIVNELKMLLKKH